MISAKPVVGMRAVLPVVAVVWGHRPAVAQGPAVQGWWGVNLLACVAAGVVLVGGLRALLS
jgi:hypothetical protein